MPAQRSQRASAAENSIQDFKPSLKPPDGTDVSRIDPTLRLDEIAKLRTLDLEGGSLMTLEMRAYNDGVAFRYVLPKEGEIRIANEKTEFRMAKDATSYPLILEGVHTPYEDGYSTMPLSGIHANSLVALPLLMELPGVAWVAITEADIDNYAGMYLQHSGGDARVLTSKLSPAVDDPGLAVRANGPLALMHKTPDAAITVSAACAGLLVLDSRRLDLQCCSSRSF